MACRYKSIISVVFVLNLQLKISSIALGKQLWHNFPQCTYSIDQLEFSYVSCHFKSSSNESLSSSSASTNEAIEGLEIFFAPNSTANIPDNFLGGLDINLLVISGSNVENFNWESFAGVHSIQQAYLTNNRIVEVDLSKFPPSVTENLDTLTLRENFLSEIPKFDKSNFVALLLLDLSFNNITKIANLNGLNLLEELILSNNLIESVDFDSSFFGLKATLTKLDLASNLLVRIEPLGDFPNLASFSVARNHLRTLEPNVFKGLGNLYELDLSSNMIVYLSRDVFMGLASLCRLYLNNNRLSSLRIDDFDHLNSLTFLELQSNKYVEVCD